MKLQKPKGTQDILPSESTKWQYVEAVTRETFKKCNYSEIHTPTFEHHEVISHSVGDTTDIIAKEVYDFHNKGDHRITLHPEGAAPVVRSFVESRLFAPEVQKPVKIYYIGSVFHYGRPQAGCLREFHQVGAEYFDSANPVTDVETIVMAYQLFQTLSIKDVTLHLNTLGSATSRAAYRRALVDYLTPMREQLSKDSQRRLDENPLRVLDSKEKEGKIVVENAPSILDYLDDKSQAHFDAVRSMLETFNIPYVINTNIVRGLDYYNHTIFEFIATVDKSELIICTGGRYDSLVEYFDEPETSGFGFGLDLKRLLLIFEKQGIELPVEKEMGVYVVVLGQGASLKVLELVQTIRNQGFSAECDYLGRKTKARSKSADAFNAKTIITLGESEIEVDRVAVKSNEAREEVTVSFDEITNNFAKVLNRLD